MNLDSLLKQVEHSIKEVLTGRQNFTGSLSLQINFQDGIPKDIMKTIERQREKINGQ